MRTPCQGWAAGGWHDTPRDGVSRDQARRRHPPRSVPSPSAVQPVTFGDPAWHPRRSTVPVSRLAPCPYARDNRTPAASRRVCGLLLGDQWRRTSVRTRPIVPSVAALSLGLAAVFVPPAAAAPPAPPAPLENHVTGAAVMEHLEQFQAIAD